MAWRWIEEREVLTFHSATTAEHGGSDGVRDAGLLASALARPLNQAGYGEPSVFELAAAYCFGIARNHPFIDGNKRTAFITGAVFLAINGYRLVAPEIDATLMMLALAEGKLNESEFAAFLAANCKAK